MCVCVCAQVSFSVQYVSTEQDCVAGAWPARGGGGWGGGGGVTEG